MEREIFRHIGKAGSKDLANIYFIGLKGTGMCALAQLLQHLGYAVSGSDVAEHFYTDDLLRASGIFCHPGFARENLPEPCELVIYSAAWAASNPEYAAARERQKAGQLSMLSYPEALACISRNYRECLAVVGAHGKTTSTLLCSVIMQALGLPASALAGASPLQGQAFLAQGTEILAVEACEYRNHFLQLDPAIVLLTSLEWDHQDFFTTYEMMRQSFARFLSKDSVHTLVYCADEAGACELAESLHSKKLRCVPYGLAASGDFAVDNIENCNGATVLHLRAQPEFPLRLRVPGEHLALNALGALAALFHSSAVPSATFAGFLRQNYAKINAGLQSFRGATRRSELLGICQEKDIFVLDDYGHHPTAVRKTLAGLKKFYPGRRLVLDFMSHTYSRTMNLHDEFRHCFGAADVLILHDIYASAREQNFAGGYSGRTLWQAVNAARQEQGQAAAWYFPQPLDALPALEQILQAGDLLVTMGAGNNRELALRWLAAQSEPKKSP